MDLREKVARLLIAEVSRQTDGRWPYDGDDGLCILIDDNIDLGEMADAVLAIPEIAEALRKGKLWDEEAGAEMDRRF